MDCPDCKAPGMCVCPIPSRNETETVLSRLLSFMERTGVADSDPTEYLEAKSLLRRLRRRRDANPPKPSGRRLKVLDGFSGADNWIAVKEWWNGRRKVAERQLDIATS